MVLPGAQRLTGPGWELTARGSAGARSSQAHVAPWNAWASHRVRKHTLRPGTLRHRTAPRLGPPRYLRGTRPSKPPESPGLWPPPGLAWRHQCAKVRPTATPRPHATPAVTIPIPSQLTSAPPMAPAALACSPWPPLATRGALRAGGWVLLLLLLGRPWRPCKDACPCKPTSWSSMPSSPGRASAGQAGPVPVPSRGPAQRCRGDAAERWAGLGWERRREAAHDADAAAGAMALRSACVPGRVLASSRQRAHPPTKPAPPEMHSPCPLQNLQTEAHKSCCMPVFKWCVCTRVCACACACVHMHASVNAWPRGPRPRAPIFWCVVRPSHRHHQARLCLTHPCVHGHLHLPSPAQHRYTHTQPSLSTAQCSGRRRCKPANTSTRAGSSSTRTHTSPPPPPLP